MTVYVDNMRMQARVGRISARWSHMQADTDDELHEMAAKIGMRREWFQHYPKQPEKNHYDVTETRRQAAIKAGAVEETMTEGSARRRRLRQERYARLEEA